MELKVLELFGGIGAIRKALERISVPFKVVDYVEIDKYAVNSYNAMFNENYEPQDICEWDKDIEVDLLAHGSPCQDFSVAGLNLGGDEGTGTRSSLMWETVRIITKLKPKYVIWENVKNVLSKKHKHNFDKYINELDQLGYNSYYQILNAKDYGNIPQNRERVFTISIRKDIDKGSFVFPEKQELKLRLKDLLEDEVDEKYYLSKFLNMKLTSNYIQWSNSGKMQNSQAERAYYLDNECMCTISSSNNNGDKTQIAIPINNATKKGYLEAYEGDGIYTNTSNKRGTVQKGMIPALTSLQDKGVVVSEQTNKTICLNSKGGRNGIEGLQPSRKDRIYDSNGIAVTIATSDFYNPNYKIEIPLKRGYSVEGQSGLIQPKDRKYKEHHEKREEHIEFKNDNCSHSLRTNVIPVTTNNLRIRKLTPKECWRLMGFDDIDFDKAAQVNSNAQLYKQAGNSIVVNVLEEILKKLLER